MSMEDASNDGPGLHTQTDSESEKSDDSQSNHGHGGLAFRHQHGVGVGTSWEHRKPPTELAALDALTEIDGLLRPRREGMQKRYKESSLKGWSKRVLGEIRTFLNLFAGAKSNVTVKGKWIEASKEAAQALGKPTAHKSRRLRETAKKFVASRTVPQSPYGSWNISKIQEDEEFVQDINLHLQSKDKYVKASDIIEYLKDPEVRSRWGLKKTISHATAKRWMKKIGYRWVKKHRGQYADGHEREDVVNYRQNVFLPTWYQYESRMRTWDKDGNEEPLNLTPGTKPVVAWFHDESIFYANDRRESQWVHEDSSPVPYTKGEGASLMAGEHFSPDYGFCRSRDGSRTARVVWKPGKNRDGYFDSEDFLKQVDSCMDILETDYPDEEHLLIFDNATIHTKQAENALSARKMPKFTPKEDCNWGIEVTQRGPDGKIIYGPKGKPAKIKIKMGNAQFRDGTPQSLYFEDPHPRTGTFKGMAVILEERGYTNASNLRSECKDFKCTPDATQCCCRRLLFNEPDFVNIPSLLEEHCAKRGFKVLFLPKFHCELNPLEMVWGRSKYHYRLNPPSTKEEELEKNMINALETVTIDEMRR